VFLFVKLNLTSLLPGDWSIEAVTSLAIDDLL